MADCFSNSVRSYELEWGGRMLTVEFGKLAGQASGACLVRYGDTVVLATAVLSSSQRDGIDYFPLMVDFEEKLYAAGKIKGSRFIKREGRPTDEAFLAGRMIDRCIRPLFPEGMRNDVQVVVSTLSWDGENDSDVLGITAASLALSVSDIPWSGPIGGIRIGRIVSDDGSEKQEWVINPTYAAREKSELDLVVAGTSDRVVMVEAAANEVSEEAMKEAIRFGAKHLKPVIEFIQKIQDEIGKEKRQLSLADDTEEMKEVAEMARLFILEHAHAALKEGVKETKQERTALVANLIANLDEYLTEKEVSEDLQVQCRRMVKPLLEEVITALILDEEYRIDGRGLNEIRPLCSEVALLPRTHGSGLFQRGQTQVLSMVTLGPPGAEQILDTMEYDKKKRYMHHYNFPAYSVGEARPNRGPSRRDIGHGALAERALEPVIPSKEDFPYTIRVVSEVMSSNGSSSMGSTCGSTLALLDAGVKLKAPVAGIAMGLASDDSGRWKVITDLQDLEDGKGGMDFKIAGTKNGITAVQMDTKTKGLTLDICDTTIDQARDGRQEILASMARAIAAPRAELSKYAPRVESVQIDSDKIRDVIGPGGKIINEIIDKTGCEIDIEQTGQIFITATNSEGMERAKQWIKDLTREVEVGEIFRGSVVRIMDFGAFVQVLPGKDGLVHISELAPYHVNKVEDIVKLGDIVPVKVKEIDDMGRVNLSIVAAVQAGEEFEFPPAPERPEGGFSDRGSRGGPPPRGRGGYPRRNGPGGPRRGGHS